MTMPFVEGTSLKDIVKSRFDYLAGDESSELHPFIRLEETTYLYAMTRTLAEAARALARVHDQRVAHRDIKPANLLLDNQRSGYVYLCDFGLGRDLDVATAEQMRDGSGTPMYMAPERLLRFPADEVKCDIYSLGVTLYEALTLEKPFRIPGHINRANLAPYLASAQARRPCAADPQFPEELEAVVMKAMARDPRDRYDSARELAADLERRAASWSAQSARASPLSQHQPRVRRPYVLPRVVITDGGFCGGIHARSASSTCPAWP
jgi:serine/threonine-protein kinase